MNKGVQMLKQPKVQWGAIVALVVALGGIAGYYGCAPILRSQFLPVLQQGNMAHRVLSNNDRHQDKDLGKIMMKLGIPHDDGEIEDPPEIKMNSAAAINDGSAIASESP